MNVRFQKTWGSDYIPTYEGSAVLTPASERAGAKVARGPRGGTLTMTITKKKSDTELQRAVLDELVWDTRVDEAAVGVEVDDGVVTLTGTVASWGARVAAQEAAHRVAGVLDVANELKVTLPGSEVRDDAAIAHAVRHALEWDTTVPHERIRSTVSNAVVTLEGTVDYWSQHDDVARCVRNLAGVREVRNHIEVVPSTPPVLSANVTAAIENALERHAERAASHVHVAVVNDRIVLSGAVKSWSERRAAEGAARGTAGVRGVDNHLRVEL